MLDGGSTSINLPLTTIATRDDDAPRAALEGGAVELVVDKDEESTDTVSEKGGTSSLSLEGLIA